MPRLLLILIMSFAMMSSAQNVFELGNEEADLHFAFETLETWGSGTSLFDIDEDGWDDVTLLGKNAGYLNIYMNRAGWLQQIETNITLFGKPKHALWADYDNDGDNDLLITMHDTCPQLFRNDSLPVFTNVTNSVGLLTSSDDYYGASWGDINNDGYLDIYYDNYSLQNPNRLFINNAGSSFTDITFSAGVDDSLKTTISSLFVDFNEDGLVDLFIVNDHFYDNDLLLNNGDSTFTSVGTPYELDANMDGMGVTIMDFTDDNYPDLFVTNTPQGNRFFVNLTATEYHEIGDSMNIDTSVISWGCNFFDPDLDMDEDLIVLNGPQGYIGTDRPNFFFENNGSTFVNDTAAFGWEDEPSYSSAVGDFDRDGDPDIIVHSSHPGKAELWMNRQTGGNQSFTLRLEGTESNRNAFGSMITSYQGGQAYRRWHLSNDSYLGQNSQHLTLSTGDSAGLDSLNVRWPSGNDTTLYEVKSEQMIRLVESGEAYPFPLIYLPNGPVICSEQPIPLVVKGAYTNLSWSTGSTNDTILVDQPGTYTVTVTNQFGVSGSASATIISASNPAIELEVRRPKCFGSSNGSIEVIASTGQTNLRYIWNTGSDDEIIEGLDTGFYAVTVTNEYRCKTTKTHVLTQPDTLRHNAITSDPACHGQPGGSIMPNMSGGTPPYWYVWSDGSFQTNRMNLSAGTYTVSVTDVQQCVAYGTFELNQPSKLVIDTATFITQSDPPRWSAMITPSGTTPPYTYRWSHDVQLADSIALDLDTGVYTVTVSDANECEDSARFVLEGAVGFSKISTPDPHWFPNPTNGVVRHKGEVQFEVAIYDLHGRLLMKDSGEGPSSIDLRLWLGESQLVIIETRIGNQLSRQIQSYVAP